MTVKVQVMSVGMKDMSTQPSDVEKMPGPDVETVLEVQVISLGYNLVKMWC